MFSNWKTIFNLFFVLRKVNRRFKHENILLDVVKWVISQSIKNVAYFIISDLFQDVI